jgi:hypothetical protein
MVLISIQPFAFKKIVLLVAALLCLSSAICFADSLFMSLHSPPYGHHFSGVNAVQERSSQPGAFVNCPSVDGAFAHDSGWRFTGMSVLRPTIGWLAFRSEEVGGDSYAPPASTTLYAKN